MRRREFRAGAAAAVGLARAHRVWAQARPNARDDAKLARVAIMTLCFKAICDVLLPNI
jgi:hypothetical protein